MVEWTFCLFSLARRSKEVGGLAKIEKVVRKLRSSAGYVGVPQGICNYFGEN